MMGARPKRMILLIGLVAATISDQRVNAAPEAPSKQAAPSETPTSSQATPDALAGLDAPLVVRMGNEQLKAGDPNSALEAYERAKIMVPDAREIDFAQGLAEYARGDYERARKHFENAATSTNSALVDDAIYSVGTTYHKQALERGDDPKARIAGLEQAMQQYQSLLSERPDHAAARDANFKAASAWRQLKQQMQEQEQQQQGDGEKNEERNEEKNENDQQQDQQQNQDDQQEKDGEPQDQENQQPSNEAQQDKNDEGQDQNAQQANEGEDEQKEQQPSAEQEENISRDQAERQLREMMQRIRDRKKKQRKQHKPITMVPVDKDW